MSTEDFMLWKEKYISKRKVNIKTFFVDGLLNDKPFYGKTEEFKAKLKSTSHFLNHVSCEVNLEQSGEQNLTRVTTQVPNYQINYIVAVIIMLSIATISILPKWVKSQLTSNSIDFLSIKTYLPIIMVSIVILFGLLRSWWVVRKVHRLVKESLINK